MKKTLKLEPRTAETDQADSELALSEEYFDQMMRSALLVPAPKEPKKRPPKKLKK